MTQHWRVTSGENAYCAEQYDIEISQRRGQMEHEDGQMETDIMSICEWGLLVTCNEQVTGDIKKRPTGCPIFNKSSLCF